MTDYSQQLDQLNAAAEICKQHTITAPINGIQPEYPRWPEAWEACEIVWRAYLDAQTMQGTNDEADRDTVISESRRLKGF